MAGRVVVQIPAGSPLTKMSQDEIKSLVEQATSHLPQAEQGAHGEQLVLQTGEKSATRPDIGGWAEWTRGCGVVRDTAGQE